MNALQDEVVALAQGQLNGLVHDLKPDTDGGRALGTTALRFKNLRLFLGTLTDQLAAIDIAGTWNDAADTFTAIKANITDTASAAASLLIDLQVGGSSKFSVDKSGKALLGADPTAALGAVTKQYADARAVGVLNRDVTEQEVVNTTTETVVYTFSVPGGTLSTNNALRLVVIGDYLQNDATARDLTVKVKFGGTTIFNGTINGFPQGANRRGQYVEATIHAQNATNDQVSATVWRDHGINTATGTAAGGAAYQQAVHNAIAVDSTLGQTLEVTVQHSVALATVSFFMRTAYLEVVR